MSCSTSCSSRRRLVLLAVVFALAGHAAEGRTGPTVVSPVAPAAAPEAQQAMRVAPERIAVLPVDNLSGVRAPLKAIEQSLKGQLQGGGIRILDDERLASFMRDHRLRYTGGVDAATAKAFHEEIGADAILVSSLETFRDGAPPKMTLHARLVAAGDDPAILWADSVGMAGDEAPGLLGLGLITGSPPLLDKVVRRLVHSLVTVTRSWRGAGGVTATAPASARDGGGITSPRRTSWRRHPSAAKEVAARYEARFRPRSRFRSRALDRSPHYSVAVLPFLNVSERKHADTILALHFVEQLLYHGRLTVMEPGTVREELLRTRSVMAGGPSLAVADLFFHREYPDIDLILSGQVFDYQDQEGVPKVDFSVQVFEKTTRKVVWFSRSFNDGDEDVVFFDLGRQHTAHALVSRMANAATELMMR